MTEASEKKIRKHIAELIVDRYDRELSGKDSTLKFLRSLPDQRVANEYRAIRELPLGKFEDLDDISKNGIRIWDLLCAFERGSKQEASLLEEAGRLLWAQVINAPKPASNPTGNAEEQEAFVEECRRRNVAAPKPAKGSSRDIPKEAKKPKPRKELKAKESGVLREGERLVLFGAPWKTQDQEPRGFSEWDADAIVPPRKRSKYTHGPLVQRDIHSQSHSITKEASQGQEIRGYSKPTTAQGKPASGPLSTRDEGIPSIPRPSKIPTSQSQSSDQPGLAACPTKMAPPETLNHDTIRQAANNYYTSQGSQERPQPYAPGNFSKYILFKDG